MTSLVAMVIAVVAAAPAPHQKVAHKPKPKPPPVLAIGVQRKAVRPLEQRLAALRFLPEAEVDRTFDAETWHAVVAFQGWNNLVRDGVVGPRTRKALPRARRPRPWSKTPGIEVHIAQQVLLLVRHGKVIRASHVSTGA